MTPHIPAFLLLWEGICTCYLVWKMGRYCWNSRNSWTYSLLSCTAFHSIWCTYVLTACCSKLCIAVDSWPHTTFNSARVCNVSYQTINPSTSVNAAHTMISQPWSLSQNRLLETSTPGSEMANVTKTKTALTAAAGGEQKLSAFNNLTP